MMTSSNGKKFRVTGHLWGDFTGHRWIPRTKVSEAELRCFLWSVFFNQLSKQSWCWWVATPSRPLWRHCNGGNHIWMPQCQGSNPEWYDHKTWWRNSNQTRQNRLHISWNILFCFIGLFANKMIIQIRTSNYINIFVWDIINHQCPNLNVC